MVLAPRSAPARRWDVLVAAVAALAFLPSLGGTTVWDDEYLTTRNPFLAPGRWTELLTRDLWLASAKQEESGYYRPLAALTLAVNRLLSNEPWSYHLGNVLLHVGVALALRRLVLAHRPRAEGAATVGALLFALAPISSEAVDWLSGRFDLLGTLFLVLALRWNVARRTGLVVLAFAGALASKETFVVAPALFALDDVLHRRIGRGAAAAKYAALAAVVLAAGLARRAFHVPSAVFDGRLIDAEAFRAYTSCLVLYAGVFVRAIPPSIFHVYRDHGSAQALVVAAIVSALTLAGAVWAWRARPRRTVWFGGVAVLLSLVPVGLTAPRLFQTGDRYAYTAAALAAATLAIAFFDARRRSPLVARGALVLLAVFAVAGVPSLLRRHDDWRDEEGFFRAELDRDPERYWAAALLGEILARKGDWAEAERLLLSAQGRIPRPYRVETALCFVYLNEGRLPEARARCDAALAIQPDDPRALSNRANVRLLLGDAEGALDDARHTVRVKPSSAEAHVVAAEALLALGRRDEARLENDAALAISPGHARALRLRTMLGR